MLSRFDAALVELLLQLVDLLKRVGVVGLALLVRLALRRELIAEALVLAHFLVPFLLRVAAADETRRRARRRAARAPSRERAEPRSSGQAERETGERSIRVAHGAWIR